MVNKSFPFNNELIILAVYTVYAEKLALRNAKINKSDKIWQLCNAFKTQLPFNSDKA